MQTLVADTTTRQDAASWLCPGKVEGRAHAILRRHCHHTQPERLWCSRVLLLHTHATSASLHRHPYFTLPMFKHKISHHFKQRSSPHPHSQPSTLVWEPALPTTTKGCARLDQHQVLACQELRLRHASTKSYNLYSASPSPATAKNKPYFIITPSLTLLPTNASSNSKFSLCFNYFNLF